MDVQSTREDALRLMDEHDVRHVPVVEDGRVVGVLSDRDLFEAIGDLTAEAERALAERRRTVRELMHAPPVTASPEDSVVTISVDLVLRGIGCLPVLWHGVLVGIVTEFDLLKAYLRACQEGERLAELDPPVRERSTPEPLTLGLDASVAQARELLRSTHIRHLPVVEDGRLVGVVSDRDVRRARGRGVPDTESVEAIMARDPLSVGPGELLSSAAAVMNEHKISCLPVVQDGRLVALMTLTDVLDHCMNTLRESERSASG